MISGNFRESVGDAIRVFVFGTPLMFIFIMTCAHFGWFGLGGAR